MWVTKLLIFPVEIKIFCPKMTKFGIFGQFGPGHAGLFGALLVGQLVVVARGLYLARHLFTLLVYKFETFCGVSIHHLAALVQKELQNKKIKIYWDTLIVNLPYSLILESFLKLLLSRYPKLMIARKSSNKTK